MSSRIANFAKPGSLFKQYAPRKRAADLGREPRQVDPKHLALVRKLPCVACGCEHADAAHVRTGSAAHGKRSTGAGEKPDDKWTLPLCRSCHKVQHAVTELPFWWQLQISPVKLCMDLYRVSGDMEGMRKVIEGARR